jgi:predicted DCC family thiol-disulfide oxidoreductase YuxK
MGRPIDMTTERKDHGALLLYDGTCGFCCASVQFVLAHERSRTLRFAALQGSAGSEVVRRHPHLNSVDSVVWYERETASHPETVLVKSDAVLRIARYLGGGWRLFGVMSLVPRAIRDSVYDLVARNRHRLPGTADACLVPPPEARERFIGNGDSS